MGEERKKEHIGDKLKVLPLYAQMLASRSSPPQILLTLVARLPFHTGFSHWCVSKTGDVFLS